ncbi:MAG TPA: hypothetical protein VGN97_14540 [Mesorhizobium sp.]|nr:hypothetical protein [Mesorhizobium sp.]
MLIHLRGACHAHRFPRAIRRIVAPLFDNGRTAKKPGAAMMKHVCMKAVALTPRGRNDRRAIERSRR